jgi:hypothetical protein
MAAAAAVGGDAPCTAIDAASTVAPASPAPHLRRVICQLYSWLGARGHVDLWEDDKEMWNAVEGTSDAGRRRRLAAGLHSWLTAQGKVVARGKEGCDIHFCCGPAEEYPELLWQHLSSEEVCRALPGEAFLVDLMMHHCLNLE